MDEIILEAEIYNILVKALKENAEALYIRLIECSIQDGEFFQVISDEDFFLELDSVAARLLLDYGVSYNGKEPYVNELGLAMENVIDRIVAM